MAREGSKYGNELRDGMSARVGSTKRIQNLNALLHSHKPSLDLHRTRCMTKVFQETEGAPILQRRYRATAEMIRTLPATVYPGERLLGWGSSKMRANMLAIDCHAWWLDEDLDIIRTRDYDPFDISDEEIEELRTVHIPYWKHKSASGRYWCTIPEGQRKYEIAGIYTVENYFTSVGSHTIPDYPTLMQNGFKHYYKLCEKGLAELDKGQPDYMDKYIFYTSMMEVIKAIRQYGENFALEAERQAAYCTDPVRKQELLDGASCIRRVTWDTPRSFYEALELTWLPLVFLNMEGCGAGNTYGRIDQYLYPFYKADIEKGVLTREEALEYIEELYIKTAAHTHLQSTLVANFVGGYYRYPHLDLGGLTRDGEDASNELSYLFLRAMRMVKTSGPSVCLLLHQKTPESLLEEAVKLAAEGMGHPSIFNCETMYRMMEHKGDGPVIKAGLTKEEILEYGCAVGCTETGIAGIHFGHTNPGAINLAFAASLAVTGGIRAGGFAVPGVSVQVGELQTIPTMNACDMKTYEDYENAVKEQIAYSITACYASLMVVEKILMEEFPLAFFTLFIRGCIEKGEDVVTGAARVNIGPTIAHIGFADAVNSLAAVEKVIFEEKKYTMEDLEKAIFANWDGYEEFRQEMRKAPKYGNGDSYVDDIAVDIWKFVAANVTKHVSRRGNYIEAQVQMTQANIWGGIFTPATPNGRFGYTALADTMSAEAGTDFNGPTGLARTYGRLDYPCHTGGTTLNMWISQSELMESTRAN